MLRSSGKLVAIGGALSLLVFGCATGVDTAATGGATATGGVTATGGSPGTGGGLGTGGAAVGTGGVGSGSGGASVASTGGAGGSAALPGTGGAVTMVGSGGASSSGSGGISVVPNYTDDFESDTAGQVAKTWITDPDPAVAGMPGMWLVAADGAGKVFEEQTQYSSLSLAVGGNVNWTDLKVETRVKVVSSSSTSSARITLAGRYQDAKNYFLLELTLDGKIKLRVRANGSSSDIATNDSKTRVPLTVGSWVTVGLSISGPATAPVVAATLGGTPVTFSTLTPQPGPASGGIALGVTDAVVAFDDVHVTLP